MIKEQIYWLFLIVYLFPIYVVNKKFRGSKLSDEGNNICLINLFLGWTLIGWFYSLIKAIKLKPEVENISFFYEIIFLIALVFGSLRAMMAYSIISTDTLTSFGFDLSSRVKIEEAYRSSFADYAIGEANKWSLLVLGLYISLFGIFTYGYRKFYEGIKNIYLLIVTVLVMSFISFIGGAIILRENHLLLNALEIALLSGIYVIVYFIFYNKNKDKKSRLSQVFEKRKLKKQLKEKQLEQEIRELKKKLKDMK